MKKILFVFFLALTTGVSAQEINKHHMDETRLKEILLNVCTRAGITSFPEFKVSYDANYTAYKIDSTKVALIKSIPQDYKITMVLGTWCGDSKLQVPHLFKIFDNAGIKEENIKIIAVNGVKQAENNLLEGLNIQRVPTIIIKNKDGIEIGRIVERPTTTLESDLLAILSPKI
ncbi:thioredoxin family protein [Pedobacter flavus]|uniref:Thioredoxin family protein n=1 Tax=Pedobacter flavus TaxID=3113906 RepID=A0ABU7H2D2_9SPHI|nr:thioredoxin family protein [Pedobacter sp. VNH31]MEE1885476.1 thioredoxin family protein [Pedobacter sp. VNH31]